MARRLSREELLPALKAWAYVSGYGGALSESLPPALGWLRALWEEGHDALPLDLVHDLGTLLVEGRAFAFASSRDLADWPEEERAERLQYEDRVLGKWVLDPSVGDAHVAIAALSGELQPRALAHAIGLALGPASRRAELDAGNPAVLRSSWREALALCASWPARHGAWEEPPVDANWRAWALAIRAAIVGGLGEGKLFSPEDLWELAHLADLPNESSRLALRELHAATAAIGGVSPSVAMAVRRKAQEVAVDEEDASHYPAGGFDALSTRGRFENLVRSEVAYVDSGREELGMIDLFDVRFAQGELLYYTRDESPLFDQRRRVTVVIERPLDQRHKHPELDAQTLVLVDATTLRLQADMMQVFGPSGAELHLRWRTGGKADAEAAEEEARLMAMTLADDLAHRRVTLATMTDWQEAPPRGLVVFAAHQEDPRAGARAWVRVGEPRWVLDGESFAVGEPGGLRALLDALLLRLFA
ncbi:hypothetical protein SAMN02745121_03199 [Nannocystis exedens]|uniref:Uncharacterized protein n=1 Tax=Nannocystis exedens TaxID=54 RepID=A0A1I1YB93_9BACT|nr:hypothetical protein [Nannocystis exedens]PCC71847.1 hypothetical protein NAEX_04926 [Nannocystis exedens]SFE15150.1 hypothetical protein SAMN02745121_03199 [Nannocystis exedens]